MCRSIHILYNIDPPATQEEIHAASVQFVRKVSGYRKPSKANEVEFTRAVIEIEAVISGLLSTLKTESPVRARSMGVSTRS